MLWESQYLPEFIRIFPRVAVKESDVLDEEEEGKDDDDNEGGDKCDEVSGLAAAVAEVGSDTSAVITKSKRTSFEDIVVEVFLQDRRQTMRMYCPLPNKTRASESQTGLPPLESKAHLLGSIAAGISKSAGAGGGWRAPPKSEKPLATPAQLTQNQIDAARRLSQGLSVKPLESGRDKRDLNVGGGTAGMLLSFAGSQNPGYDNEDLMSLAASVNLDDVSIPPRIRRLREQKRLIRIKYENARNVQQASVLRQQIYKFDQSTASNAANPQFFLDQNSVNPPSGMRQSSYPTTNSSAGSSAAFRNSNVMLGAGMTAALLDKAITGYPRQQLQGHGQVIRQQVLVGQLENLGTTASSRQQGKIGSSTAEPRISDQLSQEEILKNIFPGWF